MIMLLKKNYLLVIIPVCLLFFCSFGVVSNGCAEKAPLLAKGVFLVATTDLQGPFFRQSVILIVEHNKSRTSGLIINRPSNHYLSQLSPDFRKFKNSKKVVFVGGPLMPNIAFLLFKAKKDPGRDAIKIFDNVYFSHKLQIFPRLKLDHEHKNNFRIYSGYSGWKPGQLEREILRGSWKVVRANSDVIFNKNPDQIWDYLIKEEDTKHYGIMAKY